MSFGPRLLYLVIISFLSDRRQIHLLFTRPLCGCPRLNIPSWSCSQFLAFLTYEGTITFRSLYCRRSRHILQLQVQVTERISYYQARSLVYSMNTSKQCSATNRSRQIYILSRLYQAMVVHTRLWRDERWALKEADWFKQETLHQPTTVSAG